jgi:CRISPR-associated protein Cas2
MMVLVSYDVSTKTPAGKKRLHRVAKICLDYGQRVQNSVFECIVDPAQWAEFRHRLETVFNPDEDSLRYYFMGANWQRRVEHMGAKPAVDLEGPLLV